MSQKLSKTTIGPFEITSIECGRFRLDGGAMFGVVPKTLWSKLIESDDKNRIPMAMRCLLIKSLKEDKLYLVDNGSGTKFNEKMSNIYALDYEHSNLEDSLKQAGVHPDDITDMVFSHLHFDHCGGSTFYNESGELEHRFKNAVYHVNKRHWENATHPNDREKASFLKENIEPLKESRRLNLVDDFHSFEDGFDSIPVNGHTTGQHLPRIQHDDLTLVYAADLFPTSAHVPVPWVMGYDMYPVLTLQEKRDILEKAVENKWYFFMEHDAFNEVITISDDNGRYKAGDSLTLDDIGE